MKKGFTLVELLVVISIISILAVIGLTVYGDVQKSARDTKRKGDIDATFQSFEQHYQVSQTSPYPKPDVSWFSSGAFPSDPQGGDYFWNGGSSDCSTPTAPSSYSSARSTFTICAKLENGNGNSTTCGDGATYSSSSEITAGFYCVKNLR